MTIRPAGIGSNRMCWLLCGMLLFAMAAVAGANGAPFTGSIAADQTRVFAGGAQSYYVVGELPKGAVVQVHEVVIDWYRIAVPDGINSYIAKGFVNVQGDGKTGTIAVAAAEVKIAAPTGPKDSTRICCTLSQGETVQIIGEDGSYYKIVTPKSASVWLAPDALVNAVRSTVLPVPEPAPAAGTVESANTATQPLPLATQPQTIVQPQPSAALALAEAKLQAAMKLPVDQQPIDELVAAYEKVSQDPNLLTTERRIVQIRLTQLKRNGELASALKGIEDVRREINLPATPATQPRPIKAPHYDAIGQILVSGVYDGTRLPLLYRMVEPTTLQTVAYLQKTDAFDPGQFLGRLVGILGEKAVDTQLQLPIFTVKKIDVLEAIPEEGGR